MLIFDLYTLHLIRVSIMFDGVKRSYQADRYQATRSKDFTQPHHTEKPQKSTGNMENSWKLNTSMASFSLANDYRSPSTSKNT